MDVLSRIRTGDYLDAAVFPAMQWAVHGLIPEGFGLFTGPPKAGKSWAALGVALAIATGGNALGRVPVGTARPVLYLALEDGERRLQGRCRHLLGDEPIPANLHYLTAASAAEVLPVIEAWLGEHGHLDPVVILDTLGRVMPPALPGEGAYQRDYRIGARLKSLSDAHPGSTLLVVHHTRKAGSEDWMDSTSGTNGLNGAADFTVNLSRTRNEDGGVLRVTGRDVAESEYAVTNREGRWELDGQELAEAARKAQEVRVTSGLGDQSAKIVRLVGEHPDGIGPTPVAKALGMEPKHAGEYLSRLVDAGRIEKVDRGKYAPYRGVESVESVETDSTLVSTAEPDSTLNSTLSTLSTGVGECSHCGGPIEDSRDLAGLDCLSCYLEVSA